jgi:hypothetical protein
MDKTKLDKEKKDILDGYERGSCTSSTDRLND